MHGLTVLTCCLRSLKSLVLPGLKGLEFQLGFKLFGEVKAVGMVVNEGKWNGLMRGSEEDTMWKGLP